jgi:hypothetical protein
MLPIDCHYVAEIRYQEHAEAARTPCADGVQSSIQLPLLTIGRPSFDVLRRWLEHASYPVVPARIRAAVTRATVLADFQSDQ